MNKVRESIEELKQAIRDTVDQTKEGKTVMRRMYRAVKGSVKVATKGFKVNTCYSIFPCIRLSLMHCFACTMIPSSCSRFPGRWRSTLTG